MAGPSLVGKGPKRRRTDYVFFSHSWRDDKRERDLKYGKDAKEWT